MKKIIFILAFFVGFSAALLAQNNKSADFGVMIMYFPEGSGTFDVSIDDNKVFTISVEQAVKFTYYSQGKVEVEVRHSLSEIVASQFSHNFKHGDTVYYKIENTSLGGLEADVLKKTSEAAWEEIKKAEIQLKKEDSELEWRELQEDTENPIIPQQVPTSVIAFEPVITKRNASGFLLPGGKHIVTNLSAVEGATQIGVRGINGYKNALFFAKITFKDSINGLAILELLDPINLGDAPYLFRNKAGVMGETFFSLGYENPSSELGLKNGIINSNTGFMANESKCILLLGASEVYNGSPYFDRDGYLMGVIDGAGRDNANTEALKINGLKETVIKAGIKLPNNTGINKMKGKSLAEQVKVIENFVYIIEAE